MLGCRIGEVSCAGSGRVVEEYWRSRWCGQRVLLLLMAAFIGGSKRKIFYVVCYSMMSTVPVRSWFFFETGELALEKCNLIVFGDGRKVSPYVKGREGVGDGRGGHHGGVGGRCSSYVKMRRNAVPGLFLGYSLNYATLF